MHIRLSFICDKCKKFEFRELNPKFGKWFSIIRDLEKTGWKFKFDKIQNKITDTQCPNHDA